MILAVAVLSGAPLARGENEAAISPKDAPVRLFNGKNLDGLYTWLQHTKYEDPKRVFAVEDGILHMSGDEMGYVCTKQRYKDYHLVVEYRWGDRTFGSRKTLAKSSGVFLHCGEPDGAYHGQFLAGLEAQIIEGGTGDFELIRGKRADGSDIHVSFTAEVAKDRDPIGLPVWQKGGQRTAWSSRAIWRLSWFGHEPQWQNVLGYRGKHDLDSPGKEWTRLDLICYGGHVKYYVNGVLANEVFDAEPSSGKIMLQCEEAEIYFRRFELLPLEAAEKN
jgi:hypothetical protein